MDVLGAHSRHGAENNNKSVCGDVGWSWRKVFMAAGRCSLYQEELKAMQEKTTATIITWVWVRIFICNKIVSNVSLWIKMNYYFNPSPLKWYLQTKVGCFNFESYKKICLYRNLYNVASHCSKFIKVTTDPNCCQREASLWPLQLCLKYQYWSSSVGSGSLVPAGSDESETGHDGLVLQLREPGSFLSSLLRIGGHLLAFF